MLSSYTETGFVWQWQGYLYYFCAILDRVYGVNYHTITGLELPEQCPKYQVILYSELISFVWDSSALSQLHQPAKRNVT